MTKRRHKRKADDPCKWCRWYAPRELTCKNPELVQRWTPMILAILAERYENPSPSPETIGYLLTLSALMAGRCKGYSPSRMTRALRVVGVRRPKWRRRRISPYLEERAPTWPDASERTPSSEGR